jgi:hypothetical protein
MAPATVEHFIKRVIVGDEAAFFFGLFSAE